MVMYAMLARVVGILAAAVLLGRLQNRVADLARAQLAALEALACGAAGCIAIAERRVSRCQERLRLAARNLDRVPLERGEEEDGRRRLVPDSAL